MYILEALTWTHTLQMEEYWSCHERVLLNDLTTPSTLDDTSDDASTGVNDSMYQTMTIIAKLWWQMKTLKGGQPSCGAT